MLGFDLGTVEFAVAPFTVVPIQRHGLEYSRERRAGGQLRIVRGTGMETDRFVGWDQTTNLH